MRHNGTGGPFYRDEACGQAEDLADDQALVIDSPAGLVVLVGCAHAGVVNTLTYVLSLTGRTRVHAVIGGLHLLRASAQRIEANAAALVVFGVDVIAPCHCTGFEATSYFRHSFAGRCIRCSVGFECRIA